MPLSSKKQKGYSKWHLSIDRIDFSRKKFLQREGSLEEVGKLQKPSLKEFDRSQTAKCLKNFYRRLHLK